MDEDNDNSNVSTAGADEQARKERKQQNSKNAAQKVDKAKKVAKAAKFVATNISIIGPILIVVLIIIMIIGFVGFFTSLPGIYLENIKEFGINLWANISGWFTGDNITPAVTEEDQIELAQRIQDMGYDLVGYGFADVEYELDEAKTLEETENVDNTDIDGYINGKIIGINKSIDNKNYLQAYIAQSEAMYALTTWSFSGFFQNLFNNPDGLKNINSYSKGMINIDNIEKGSALRFNPKISIDREKQRLRVDFQELHIFFFSFTIGDTYYFDMTDWTARYGKPIELFLSLHLATMMPDLTYELANADCFNTKVNLDFQAVHINAEVSYKMPDGTVITQAEIEKDIEEMKKRKEEEQSGQGQIVEGDEPVTLEGRSSDDDNDEEETTSIFTDEQLEEFEKLIQEGKDGIDTYMPRIGSVDNHWYYESVDFKYGRANTATKKADYELVDEDNSLGELDGSIILDQTLTANGGVYYQLCEPEFNGPNDAIKALFKGGKGTFNGTYYEFPGEYYRYDGTRDTALRIANAKAFDENKDKFTFQNEEYETVDPSKDENYAIEKQKVTFENTDENGNKSYDDAFTAFAILENTHTEDAEWVYRNLRDLLIELDYFEKEDFVKPLKQVLLWPINIDAREDEDKDNGVERDVNEYGLFLRNGVAFHTGDNVRAPGDATVEKVEGDAITIKFKTISESLMNKLKLQDDEFKSIDRNIVLDMQMTISGIEPDVAAGDTIKVGDTIGKATDKDMRIIMYNIDKSIVDNIEDYMTPNYEDVWGSVFIENDYIVDISKDSENVIDDVETFKKAFSPYENIVDNAEAFIEMQEKYNVNAVFAAAVTIAESTAGTEWAAIPSWSYNWFSITGEYNGNSTPSVPGSGNNRVWRVYGSFAEAVDDFGNLISHSSYYFGGGRYTISEVSGPYCGGSYTWATNVSNAMTAAYERVRGE